MRTCIGVLVGVLLLGATAGVRAQEQKPMSLDQLLEKVRQGWRTESELNKKREEFFRAEHAKQLKMLKEAKAELERQKKLSEKLELTFDKNEAEIARLEQTLQTRMGTMGELFGVIRQMAGDAMGQLKSSLVAAQYPGREKLIKPLVVSKGLPTIEQLHTLWYLLQQEMVESGKVVRFTAPVITPTGEEKQMKVVRVGVFNAVADGKYLGWDIKADNPKLKVMPRQPASRYLDGVKDLENATEGYVRFAVDPSEGQILSLLVDTPTFKERISYGGVIGYIIIVLGLLAMLGAIIRFVYLAVVSVLVKKQRLSKKASPRNPLGRILLIHEQNPALEISALESKLDEAILRESTKLNRFLWAIKIVSVVAPLLGLLGTVTGMIRVFQDIMLMGTGDPKIMAGGISEALVTTMLGLMTAVPLVLLHSLLISMSRRVVEVLELQSAGIVARRREEACEDASQAG
ncbi:MAG: hypothetical protein D6806_16290 [Deltaproteobacteria bacterium]|nr:MAG: hypothetical protein D6806_16290 [Deltaproteobacteria bacterium]